MKTNDNENRIIIPEKLARPRRYAHFRKTRVLLAVLLLLGVSLVGMLMVACGENETNEDNFETIIYHSYDNTIVSMKWVGATTPPEGWWTEPTKTEETESTPEVVYLHENGTVTSWLNDSTRPPMEVYEPSEETEP